MHGLRRRNAPTFVDLERNDAPYVPPVCTFVYSFFVTKVRYVTARTRAPACEACTRVSPLSLSLSLTLYESRRQFLSSPPVPFSFPKSASIVCLHTYVQPARARTYVRTLERYVTPEKSTRTDERPVTTPSSERTQRSGSVHFTEVAQPSPRSK